MILATFARFSIAEKINKTFMITWRGVETTGKCKSVKTSKIERLVFISLR